MGRLFDGVVGFGCQLSVVSCQLSDWAEKRPYRPKKIYGLSINPTIGLQV